MRTRPGYIRLYESGELFGRIAALNAKLKACVLCPRRCAVDRTSGARGVCGTGPLPIFSAAHPHFGEEPPLTGLRGQRHRLSRPLQPAMYLLRQGGQGSIA